ncbi:DNA-binding CsgD family transcriptional regulator/extradiol dioxygenase family protein [Povalibacter uvarum]|uniref:DNA-binding CsgD family transcriptional regulator/extradiol dioxygenase family protein n=1 Tax=Povalibacter uvarum TaxID=732238 RepID=A0A841HKQ9_9GAMM|nr:VOC family protein [Povalibacter uvarum]MBB6092959.1 DNA-binding CsgD family transcriptional regulator/extradiol dioxygenase family protein [Povalibacter uvarum]
MNKRPRRGRPAHDDVLTPKEWHTLHAIQHGMTQRAVAKRQGVSVDAVKYHARNIREKLGVADRSEMRRWFRAPRDSALAKEIPVEAPLQLGPIGQIARTVRDIREASDWYGRTLGLPHLYTFGHLAFFDCGGTRLMLTDQHGVKADESILYLRVPDIQAAHRELGERGIQFDAAPHMIHRHADGTEEWMAFFKDPEGRPLAIMAQARK